MESPSLRGGEVINDYKKWQRREARGQKAGKKWRRNTWMPLWSVLSANHGCDTHTHASTFLSFVVTTKRTAAA